MIPTHPTRRLLPFAVALVAAFAAGRAAAESPDPVRHYKDTFPKIAGLNIGSPQNYADPTYQSALAKYDFLILGLYRNWTRGGESPRQVVLEIKARNPNVLLANYTCVMELYAEPDNLSSGDIYKKVSSEVGPNAKGDWWARDANGKHLSSYPRTWSINITRFVRPDANGDRYPEWLAKRNQESLFGPVPEMDICFSDNTFYKPRANADWEGNGVNESRNDETVRRNYRQAVAEYWAAIKKANPRLLIMGNVDGNSAAGAGYLREPEYAGKIEGALDEKAMGASYSEESFSGWKNMLLSYESLIDHTAPPHLVVFGVAGGATDYVFLRYALATALMEDGYLAYTIDGETYTKASWYDEFDLKLGHAVDGPQRAPWKDGLYRRRFENGMAIVNPKGNGARTVSIEPGYSRFKGVQDPVTNDGTPVTAITLPDRSGIILIRSAP